MAAKKSDPPKKTARLSKPIRASADPEVGAHESSPSANHPGVEAVFFDIRDTLAVVDRKGHMLKYKPTTDQLLEAMTQVVGLRIGLITNLPANLSAADGKKIVDEAGISPFLDAQGLSSTTTQAWKSPRPKSTPSPHGKWACRSTAACSWARTSSR